LCCSRLPACSQKALEDAFESWLRQDENIEDAARVLVIRQMAPTVREAAVPAVFDGVGGHRYGRVASSIASLHFARLAAAALAVMDEGSTGGVAPHRVIDVLVTSLTRAHQAILHRVHQEPRLTGMATTAVAAILLDGLLHVAWAGDSRCYVYSEGGLRRMTRDHRQIEELLERGAINEDEAWLHPAAHTITRCLGQPGPFEPEVRTCRIGPGDVVLLCSDGLTDVVTDTEIADWIAATREGRLTFSDLPQQLANEALLAGTQDNVTVVGCEYKPEPTATITDPNRTLTSAYPLQMARTMQSLCEEITHE
jgi:serine/threonine protein phosphatase PrpC